MAIARKQGIGLSKMIEHNLRWTFDVSDGKWKIKAFREVNDGKVLKLDIALAPDFRLYWPSGE